MCDGADHAHGADPLRVRPDATTHTPVRVAVAGKGGVGKTTLAAALAARLAEEGVVAIDADPDMNLAGALGVENPPAITAERALIEERAGGGGLITLTPDVEDVIASHTTRFGADGRLVTIGAPSGGDTGCMCSENAFVRSLVASALADGNVVLDMEAGIEHLGRGTAREVDAMLVVVEPSMASVETAERIAPLAADLGVDTVATVLNRTHPGDADALATALAIPVIAELPYDGTIAAAGLAGEAPPGASERLQTVADELVAALRRSAVDPPSSSSNSLPPRD